MDLKRASPTRGFFVSEGMLASRYEEVGSVTSNPAKKRRIYQALA
ncbi:hypothetical protein L580_2751 [Serratia fonticola AU-P3(3)]|nr:hypothetical protein L580_2751 [Serratia fonticola AU-P3(3)]